MRKRRQRDEEFKTIIEENVKQVYKTDKFLLKKLVTPKQQEKLEEAVQVANQVFTITADFVKLYTLYQYCNNNPLPIFDEDFYKTAIRVISTTDTKSGGRPLSKNRGLHDDLLLFYNEHFLPLSPQNARIQVSNMSHILTYMAQTMATVQETNITVNFTRYIRRYINAHFRRVWYTQHEWSDDYKMTSAEGYAFRRVTKLIKEDILFYRKWTEGYKSAPEYHEWLDSVVNVLYPEPQGSIPESGVHYDVHTRPYVYLRFMIAMNIQFEAWGIKVFSPICLRSSLSAKYVKIDTAALIDLFVTKEDIPVLRVLLNLPYLKSKRQLTTTFSKLRGEELDKKESFNINTAIWKYFFKFETNKYTRHLLKNGVYVFDNSILTDGVGVSVLQVRSDRVGFNCKSNNSRMLRIVPEDAPYFDELSQQEREYILSSTSVVGGDPGGNNIITMCDSNTGKIVRYTSQQRAVECRFKKNKKAMVSMKKNNICVNGQTVESVENSVSYVAKTCNYDNFKTYISGRRHLETLVIPALYSQLTPRKLRFSAQSHTKQSEDRLINKIVSTFKTEETPRVTIAWGDWSHPQHLRNFIPVPGVGFRKRVLRKGKPRGLLGALTHESYTSCTCYDCCSRTAYFRRRTYFKKGEQKVVNVHGLLRCQNEKCSKLWNRDVLGSKNIREVALAMLRGEPRPVRFTIAHPPHAVAAGIAVH